MADATRSSLEDMIVVQLEFWQGKVGKVGLARPVRSESEMARGCNLPSDRNGPSHQLMDLRNYPHRFNQGNGGQLPEPCLAVWNYHSRGLLGLTH